MVDMDQTTYHYYITRCDSIGGVCWGHLAAVAGQAGGGDDDDDDDGGGGGGGGGGGNQLNTKMSFQCSSSE